LRKEEWYLPEEISYTKHQLLFLLIHLNALQAGCWPEVENEIDLANADMGDPGSPNARPRFLYKPNPDAMRVAWEVVERLKRCGRDGQITRERYTDRASVKEICRKYGLERSMAFYCVQQCIKYMEGHNRRAIDYVQWRNRRD